MFTDSDWQAWGKRDPLWAVAGWPGRERTGVNPWTDEEFYALGVEWFDFERAWQSSTGYEPGTILEIGCGAGRITQMLAVAFRFVIAVDVSLDFINYARSRVTHPNISWCISAGDLLPAANRDVDAVFSCLVFQHFPDNAAQLRMFSEIWRVLKPGGTFFIQVPLHMFPGGRFAPVARALYAVFRRLVALKAFMKRQMTRLGGRPSMRGISYEVDDLIAGLRALGFSEVGVSFVHSSTNGVLHSCVCGRKPRTPT